MKWRKARKKPVVIEFREAEPIYTFAGSTEIVSPQKKGEYIHTKEGPLLAIAGEDFVIRGVEGELYPINKEIFYKTYEVIEK